MTRAERIEDGLAGWLAVAAVVAVWDAWAIRARHETLTHAFARGRRHPRARWFVLGAWGYVTAHLLDWDAVAVWRRLRAS